MALPFGLKAGLKAKTTVTFEKDGKEESVDFSAVCLANAVVYKINGKPIKTAEVPEQVKAQLIGTMLAGVSAGEVEMAEKPEVPTEAIDEAAEVAKELIEQVTIPEDVQTMSTPPAPNPMYEPSLIEQFNSIEEMVKQDDTGFAGEPAPDIDYETLLQEAEARSVDNANLRVMVEALYRRFRIYLPYINQPPKRSDISPTTGSVMNAITFGQAVQGFKTAQRTGASWNPQVIRSQIDNALNAAANVAPLPPTPEEQVQSIQSYQGQEVSMPNLHGEPEEAPYRVNRRYDSPHQSAVRSERGNERDGLDPDEVYAEPPINAQTAIIRPFVSNKRSEAKLREIASQRSASVPQNISFDDLV